MVIVIIMKIYGIIQRENVEKNTVKNKLEEHQQVKEEEHFKKSAYSGILNVQKKSGKTRG